MLDTLPAWSWWSLLFLGSFHGLNPAMGWLFAVALGLQERRGRAVAAALGPIALGHALSIALVAVMVWVLGTVVPQGVLLIAGGLAMIGFVVRKVVRRFRHPVWVGMRVGPRELVAWSFLMATAHGAGLMILPALLAWRSGGAAITHAQAGAHAHHMAVQEGSGNGGLGTAFLAVGLHTMAMLAVAGLVAAIVYRRIGVDILRRAWINVDYVWLGTMAVAGVLTLGAGIWGVVAASL